MFCNRFSVFDFTTSKLEQQPAIVYLKNNCIVGNTVQAEMSVLAGFAFLFARDGTFNQGAVVGWRAGHRTCSLKLI